MKCAMRYKFGHKFIGNVASICTVPWIFCQDEPDMLRRSKLVSNDRSLKQPRTAAAIWRKKILAKESFGMSQPAAALSFTNMMNPHLFFFRSFSLSFLLVALAMACDKPVGLSPCASKGIFFSSLSPSTCVEQNA